MKTTKIRLASAYKELFNPKANRKERDNGESEDKVMPTLSSTPTTPQNDHSEQDLEMVSDTPEMNELIEQLIDKIYQMAISAVSKDYADKLLTAHEKKVRIDELDKLMSSKILEHAWVPELDAYYSRRINQLKESK